MKRPETVQHSVLILKFFGEEIDFRFETLSQRFREMAFITRKVKISLKDERNDREVTYFFEGGISSFVQYLNRNRKSITHPRLHGERS